MSRVWKFGDNIDTDLLAPGLYMKGPVEKLAQHCLEAVDPGFAGEVQPGDIIVAGNNFGMGSSREQAAQVLRILGVQAVLAKSFGGIFYRNAFNLGLLALVCPQADDIAAGAGLSIDARGGRITDAGGGKIYACEAIPGHLLQLIEAGGLVPYLEQRMRAR
jgi:3-isopropylmalate/(R)-2-methylmalate dehydratase small subunit